MSQRESVDRDGEVVVAVAYAGLTGRQLRATTEAFKNVLISTIPATRSPEAKQKAGVLKQKAVVRRPVVSKQKGVPKPERAPKRLGTRVAQKPGKTP